MSLLRKLFPEVKHDFNKFQQIKRVREELAEAHEVIYLRDRFLEEIIDTLHATANLLYKAGYSDNEIESAILQVQDKNRTRGYYDRDTR